MRVCGFVRLLERHMLTVIPGTTHRRHGRTKPSSLSLTTQTGMRTFALRPSSISNPISSPTMTTAALRRRPQRTSPIPPFSHSKFATTGLRFCPKLRAANLSHMSGVKRFSDSTSLSNTVRGLLLAAAEVLIHITSGGMWSQAETCSLVGSARKPRGVFRQGDVSASVPDARPFQDPRGTAGGSF